MAGNVYTWETTAANNDDADSDINFAENQSAASVNNSARALMAGVAGLVRDINGTITTGGAANAYTVTSNTGHVALATGQMLGVKANHTNTGAATLNLNTIGAKAIRKYTANGDVALAGGEIVNTGHYSLRYDSTANSAAGAWILLNSTIPYDASTWTPVLTFATPGDLSVTYSDQVGTYTKIGRQVTVHFGISTSAFTHTTASGQLKITGLPFTVGLDAYGPGFFQGITKAGYTSVSFEANASSTEILVWASGSGVAGGGVVVADVPTGGIVQLYGTITYFV
jgi:hypothetical protein